jgi:hypothetical protein
MAIVSIWSASMVGTSAAEDVPPKCAALLSGDAPGCGAANERVITSSETSGGTTTSAASSSSSGPAKKYVAYNRLVTDPDGSNPCVTTGYHEEGVAPDDSATRINHGLVPQVQGTNLFMTYPPCPEQPAQSGQQAPVETRAMIAARHWEQVPLPKPQPRIAPGRAITGKLAYLETRNDTQHTYTNANTPFGTLEIVATGQYYVDWGDGDKTGPYDGEGGPWPDGTITHQYIDVGDYDVVVTEKWTATWRFGGESGVLRQLQTVGRIEDFPVQQIQAVVYR